LIVLEPFSILFSFFFNGDDVTISLAHSLTHSHVHTHIEGCATSCIQACNELTGEYDIEGDVSITCDVTDVPCVPPINEECRLVEKYVMKTSTSCCRLNCNYEKPDGTICDPLEMMTSSSCNKYQNHSEPCPTVSNETHRISYSPRSNPPQHCETEICDNLEWYVSFM